MEPGRLVRRARERAGLSQRALARRAGTSAAAVCLYEQGERMPRVDTLARLIAATGALLVIEAVEAPDAIDLEANGRTLEDLLDLADHLPQRSDPQLGFPPFALLAS